VRSSPWRSGTPAFSRPVEALVEQRTATHTVAGVLAQVWRRSPRQHGIITLVRSGAVRVHPMTEDAAMRMGSLLASSEGRDVVDAHVAVLARQLDATVLTSDPDDLRRIDASLSLVLV
jgi:predicted nucleic acid-binding protein